MDSKINNTDKPFKLPKWRIVILRILFFLGFISLAFDYWGMVLYPEEQLEPLTGVGVSFYAAFSLLCVFGIRFPLKFLPLLFVQLIYKIAWLLSTYLPAVNSNVVDDNLKSWFWPMTIGILMDILIIPWKYVYREYIKGFMRFNKKAVENM